MLRAIITRRPSVGRTCALPSKQMVTDFSLGFAIASEIARKKHRQLAASRLATAGRAGRLSSVYYSTYPQEFAHSPGTGTTGAPCHPIMRRAGRGARAEPTYTTSPHW